MANFIVLLKFLTNVFVTSKFCDNILFNLVSFSLKYLILFRALTHRL